MRYNTTILCLSGIVVALVFALAYVYGSTRPKENLAPLERGPPSTPQLGAQPRQPAQPQPQQFPENGPYLVLFYATWCGACKAFTAEWEKTKKALAGSGITVHEIESADPALVAHRIKGFPTVRLFPNGVSKTEEYIEYAGQRSADAILQFVAKTLQQ